jgi:excinuclease ABC subunit C
VSFQETLDHLPTRPGVYLFRDGAGEILYVGKAKSLRARVRSYFRGGAPMAIRTRELVRRVDGVETIVVGSEAEALILEANLIREHHPRFNVQLRDDKRYPWIRVTVQEPFPRVHVTRRIRRDGARYFGPYTSVGSLRAALEVVKRLYTVRSCRYRLPKEAPSRPCLDYHIGRCRAPCVGLQSEEDYRGMIGEILRILDGDVEGLREEVALRMREASAAMDFEAAARHRDVVQGLDALAREQRVQRVDGGDEDVVGIARDGSLGSGVVLRIRSGVLLGRETLRLSGADAVDEAELLSTFTTRFYLGQGEGRPGALPREILLPHDFEDRGLLEEVLSGRAGHRVQLRVPQRGERLRLVELAAQNARHTLEERVTTMAMAADRADDVLYQLQDRLGLKVVPRLIAGFDISHTQGSETVASVVTFENGEPKKAGYRHMRIRGTWGNDDYRSMAEAVERWLRRLLETGERLPDLILIDGGKGQLNAARAVVEGLGVGEVALASLAKRDEEIFLPGRSEPLRLSRRERPLHLLQRIRDESHRFAVTYNRKLRTRRTLESELASIPGVGPSRQKALLTRFGSVRGVREATVDEIARLPGFGEGLAHRILTYLGG